MTPDPGQEPPIDVSLAHYVEERALTLALEKATTPEERVMVQGLMAQRAVLMAQRDAYLALAIAKRHARGEVYSKARVAAINAIGPSRAQLDKDIDTRLARKPDALGVLKSQARVQIAFSLVSQRLQLADLPADMRDAAREMLAHEERFARTWLDAVGDAALQAEVRARQRELLAMLRTASRPMYCVGTGESNVLDDEEASNLGKVWAKLDRLAAELGLEQPSQFIAVADEGDAANVSAGQLLGVFERLLEEIQRPGGKFPSKKKTLQVLQKICTALHGIKHCGGGGRFEVDI